MKKDLFNSCLVIAEVAQAHDGSLGTAHAYIDAAAEAGADAIKFQTHFADEESTHDEPWRVKFSTQDETRYDYWKRMEFTEKQWIELSKHAHNKNLLFISSPFSVKAVKVLMNAGIDAWKIASGEVTNVYLLNKISETGLPVLISSGMSSIGELETAINIFKVKNIPVLLFQCTSSYPVPPEKIGLNLLKEFSDKFKCPVGLSDHSGKIYTGLAAASLGARAIEVHVTFSKKMFGPDVSASLTIDELASLCEGVKWIETINKNPLDKDLIFTEMNGYRNIFMKGLVASRLIPAGKIIEEDDLSFKKPLKGIPASEVYSFLGKKVKNDIQAGSFINYSDFDD